MTGFFATKSRVSNFFASSAFRSDPTFNTNYTADGAVWCYDTTNALGWQGLGVAAGTAATGGVFASGIAPVADTFQTLVVALMDGLGFFAILDADHNEIITSGSVGITGAVTKTTLLAPYVYVEARSATSKTVAIDRIHAWGARTTT